MSSSAKKSSYKDPLLNKKVSSKNLAIVGEKGSEIEKQSSFKDQVIENIKKNRGLHQSETIKALLEKGHITELEIANIFSEEYGFETIQNLNEYKISEDVLSLVPQKICKKNLILPLVKIDNTLVVVFSDPSNMNLRDNLSLITGHKIQPVISTRTEIKEAFNKLFDSQNVMDNLVFDMSLEVAGFEDEMAINLDKEAKENSQDAVVTFVNLIFSDAIRLKSSDIHIETYERNFRIRYRIDGALYEKHSLSRDMASVVVSRIKVMSGMDISEKRKPQDARLKIVLGGQELNMRVNSTPTINGEKIVLRILDNSSLEVDMRKLGMTEYQLNLFKKYLDSPQGLILMTGPTGSGKTTTIYSGLTTLNNIDTNICTAEDPVEFRIHGINQVQMNSKIGLTFASALRAFLRQDPDVILVGEIRDFETAEIAFKASSTGHLVLSTVHTNDTASTVTRLLSMGVPSYDVADNTSLIIAQRLMRRLCPYCRVPANDVYINSLTEIGVPESEIEYCKDKVFLKNKDGCTNCNNLGYKGRVAVYEMMEITKVIKVGIFDKLSPLKIKKLSIEKDGLVSLRQSALTKLKEGITTVDEVLRVTVSDV
ncbi:MAG: ATPase, T2SS/T4P/T4SS family [Bdellovibrionaceae bacterium]|nr:ATPase, T2SS/T4P/T4SS family [Pseudobdellovibrionaceae bacterium]